MPDPSEPSELFKLSVARDMIERLRGGAARHYRWGNLRNQIDTLTDGYTFRGYKIEQPIELVRGRKIKGDAFFDSLDQLGPPPAEMVDGFGRCQRPNQSVMYLSSNRETVLSELRVDVGDLVQFAEYRLKPTDDFIYGIVGEYDFVRRHGFGIFGNREGGENISKFVMELDELTRLRLHLTDAFMAEEFRKFAQTQLDYKITSAIADEIYTKGFGGFFYPSVQHVGGVNFALLGEHQSICECIGMSVVEITDAVGFGIYEHRNVAVAKSLDHEPLEWDRHEGKAALHGGFLPFVKMVLSMGPTNLVLCQFLKMGEEDGQPTAKIVDEVNVMVSPMLTISAFIQHADGKSLDFDYLAFSYSEVVAGDQQKALDQARLKLTENILEAAIFDKDGNQVMASLVKSEDGK